MNDAVTTLAELKALMADFVAERDWQRFHDAKNLTMALAIEAAELMEHFQWARSEELDGLVAEPATRAAIEEELADVVCFALALSNRLNIDLAAAVEAKMTKNARKYPPAMFRGRYFKPPG